MMGRDTCTSFIATYEGGYMWVLFEVGLVDIWFHRCDEGEEEGEDTTKYYTF